MINTITNNNINNYEKNILNTPKRCSQYDNIQITNYKSFFVANLIKKNIDNRHISIDNLKKLYHITTKNKNNEDNLYFIGDGSNGKVYLVSKITDQSIIENQNTKQLSSRFHNKKKHKHCILSVSKLGTTKEFILDDQDLLKFNNFVEFAKEELEYNIIMGIAAKLFIDYKNKTIQLVSEYKGSTLNDYIHYQPLNSYGSINAATGQIIKTQNLCDGLTKIITRQIIRLILTFHNKTNCIHGDIKASNILVDQLAEVTLIDFGAAIPMDNNGQIAVKDFLGTVVFSAPEIFKQYDSVNGKFLDAYSIGLVLLYIILQKEVFFVKKTATGAIAFNYKLYNATIQELKNTTNIPTDLKQITLGMLATDPKKRLSLEQALSIISPSGLYNLTDLELEFEKQITLKKLTNLKKNKRNALQNKPDLTNHEPLDIIDCSKNKPMLSYNREQQHLESYLIKINREISLRASEFKC